MSISNLRQNISGKLTKSSPTDLIESSELRAVFNIASDEIRDKGLFIVNTTAELASWNNSEAVHIGVKNVGLFKYVSSGTVDGVTYFESSDAGVWQLVLPVGGGSGGDMTKQSILDRLGAASDTNDGYLSQSDFADLKNSENIITNHVSNSSNPHGVTKAQVGLDKVVNLDTSTTQNISDFLNKRFVTDANRATLSVTSGTNTGDETQTSIITKIGYTPANVDDLSSKLPNTVVATDFSVIDNTKMPTVKAVEDRIATIPTGDMARLSADAYFTSGTGTPLVQNGNIYGLVDDLTGEDVVFSEATVFNNGTAINDTHVDGVMIRKKSTKYYKRQAGGAVKADWYLKPGTPDTIVGGISQNAAKLQKALDFIKNNGGGTLELWDGDFTVTPTTAQTWSLKPASNTQIRGYNGARLLCGTTGLGAYKMIYITGVNNVVVKGLEIVGDRDTNPGDGTFYPDGVTPYGGESGMGVYVENSTKVVMQDLKISKTWGDGIYVGNFLCKNILVDNAYVDNVRRNGMTITYVDGMVVSNSWFINTKGIPPENGIDIETNALTSVQNVLLANLFLTNNNSDGIGIAGSKIEMVNVRSMYNTMRGLTISGQNVTHNQWVDYTISNCIFEGNGYNGIDLLNGGGRVSISNSTIAANGGLLTFNVTGVTTTPVAGTTYYINGLEYTVKTTNISGGAGTIGALCTNATGARLPLSGMLAKKGIVTFSVSGVTDIPLSNELYTINGWQWFIEDANITSGSGTIRAQLASPGTAAMTNSGVLVKAIGAHQNNITYAAIAYDKVGDAVINYSSFSTLNNFGGIYCTTRGPVKITGSRILNNNGRGIFTAQYNVEDTTIVGCTIAGNTGASVFDNSNGSFIGNHVYGNHSLVNNVAQVNEGAVTLNGNNWTVTGNNIYRNQYTGIYIEGKNNNVTGNNVYGNSQVADNTYSNITASPVAANNIIQGNNVNMLGGRMTLAVSGLSTKNITVWATGVDGAVYLINSTTLNVRAINLTGTAPNISGTIEVEPLGIEPTPLPATGTITLQTGVGPATINYTSISSVQPQFGIWMRTGAGKNNYLSGNGSVGMMGKSGDIRDDETDNIYGASSTGSKYNWDIGGALSIPNRWVTFADTSDKKVLNALTDNVIIIDASAGSFDFTLSSAIASEKRVYHFKRIDTNTGAVVNIKTPSAGHYIDGKSSIPLYALGSALMSRVSLYCGNPNWYIVSDNKLSDIPVTLDYAATTNIDFNGPRLRELTLTGNVILTTSNLEAGKEVVIRIVAGAADRTVTIPGWRIIGDTTFPTIPAGKEAFLSLASFGTTDADVRAAIAVEGASSSGTVVQQAELPSTWVGVGNGDNILGGSAENTWDGITHQLGNKTNNPTATPITMNMGGTFSNWEGHYPKVTLFDNGTEQIGIGPSADQMDFFVYHSLNTGSFNFFLGGTKVMKVSRTAYYLPLIGGAYKKSVSIDSGSNLLAEPVGTTLVQTKSGSYTLTVAGAGSTILQNDAANTVITIPDTATANIDIGAPYEIIAYGTGQITIAAMSGIGIISKGNARKSNGQGSVLRLRKLDSVTWSLSGDITV